LGHFLPISYDRTGKSGGYFMRKIAGLVLCGLLAAGSAQAAECQLKMLGSVDMKVSPENLMLPVTFGNTQKNFIFDIGSGLNLVTRETADQAKFHIQSLDPNISLRAYGQQMEMLGYSPKFRIGTLPGDDVEFSILPEPMPYPDVVGVLGTRLFEKLDFELDIAHGKLSVFSTDHCPEKVVYWTKTGFAELPFRKEGTVITTKMLLDTQPLNVSLSTNRGSVMGMNMVRQLFGLDANSPGMRLANTAQDGTKFYRYPFKGLTVDALTINNPDILIRDEAPGTSCNNRPRIQDTDAPKGHVVDKPMIYVTCFGPDLEIGLSVLSKLHLYFSSREQLLYATGAGAN
jgi:hypothetical protein